MGRPWDLREASLLASPIALLSVSKRAWRAWEAQTEHLLLMASKVNSLDASSLLLDGRSNSSCCP